ncbi:telomere repeat-binding factor 2 [Rosa sericea]
MGAPKQKWTPEEEAALKAGVLKHGAGKWRTILSDKEFGAILHLRSNVDLKDKWRNINVTAIWGSRQKAKLALKRTTPTAKNDNSPLAVTTAVQSNEETADAKPLASSGGKVQTTESKPPIARLDHLIFEAITNLKEPRGSDRNTITTYIEDQYWAPSNLSKLLSTKLKHMTANGKLVKVKHRYRIPPNSATSEKRRNSSTLLSEGKQKDSTRADKSVVSILTKSQVDAELTMIRSMTAQEAAAAAAQAVAEAEAAIAAAEEAAREAEAAEAEAEAAQVFAKAAVKALKCRRLDLDMKLAHG